MRGIFCSQNFQRTRPIRTRREHTNTAHNSQSMQCYVKKFRSPSGRLSKHRLADILRNTSGIAYFGVNVVGNTGLRTRRPGAMRKGVCVDLKQKIYVEIKKLCRNANCAEMASQIASQIAIDHFKNIVVENNTERTSTCCNTDMTTIYRCVNCGEES